MFQRIFCRHTMRIAFALMALAAYLGLSVIFVGHQGSEVAALACLPVVVIGWLWGWRAGVLAGVLAFPLNTMVLNLLSPQLQGWNVVLREGGAIGSATLLLIGGSTGYLADLRRRLSFELAERKSIEEQWRASEQRFWVLIEYSSDAIALADANAIITYISPSTYKILGYRPEDLIGRHGKAIILPEDYPHARERTLKILDQPLAFALFECRVQHRDGSWRWMEISVRNMLAEPAVHALVSNYRDITERKHQEEMLRQQEIALRHRNRELLLFNQVIAAAVSSVDAESLMAVACRELALTLELPQAAVALIDADRTYSVVVAEYREPDRPSALHDHIPLADNLIADYHLTYKAPLVIDDTHTDPRTDQIREILLRRGTVSLLLVPLINDGEVIGSLGLDSIKPRRFSPEEIDLAWRVADQLVLSLARTRLNDERRRLSAVIEQAAESVLIADTAGNIVYVNPTFERVTGYRRDEVIGHHPSFLASPTQDRSVFTQIRDLIRNGQNWQGYLVNQKKDGTLFTEEAMISPVMDDHGRIMNFVSLTRDVTRELELEEQYRQAQKMEAVGRLAGGVAHDFNNLLTILMGNADLALEELGYDHPVRAEIEGIKQAATRAAALTRQLLAFARKQIVNPKVLDLNELILNVDKMLRRLIGADIELVTLPALEPGRVTADPGQLEHVLLNLVVNARDAMPNGGKITLETTNVILGSHAAGGHATIVPGPYVCLTVSDTGVGMSEDVTLCTD